MNKFTACLIFLLLLSILAASPCLSADYLGTVREAVSGIELGQYDAAASSIERALLLDDSDPLGHAALAVVYLHTGKLAEAEGEFHKAIAAKPDDWCSHYALGLIALLRKRAEDAECHFSTARLFPEARDELLALEAYLDFIEGGKESVPEAQSLLLVRQTAAMAALKSGNRNQALSLLAELLRAPAAPGFEENRSPLVTFDAKQPVALPKGKLNWKPAEHKDAATVSGMVTLKADTSRAAVVDFVLFYVDDVLVGVTNCEPFEFEWDTTRHPNGLHHIKIEGKNQSGGIVSGKSVWVRVSNANPRKSTPRSGPEVTELVTRLWNCVRVSESRKLAHYHLAKLYLEAGDREKAIQQLEHAVAYQADLLDARKLLNKLRGWSLRYAEINRGGAGSKMIALTFDDGPNERTAETLEMLERLKVPATFFVVGFRAETQPHLIRAMHAAGHQIENHTYTHSNLTSLSADQVEAELSKTAAVIHAVTGKPSMYFRPPGGHVNEAARQAAARQGFTAVFWTISCSPFEGANYGLLADHVVNNACDGAIVLMHNGDPAANSALPRIVEELRAQGYRFVTIAKMAGAVGGSASPPASP